MDNAGDIEPVAGKNDRTPGAYIDSRGVAAPALSFRDALQQVLHLASANQIQPIDVAFGDAGLADQQVWEAAAVKTVTGFLAGQGDVLDALPPATAAGDWPETTWLAERGMDPENPADAVCIVLAMAESAAVDVATLMTPEEADKAEGQQLAFDVTRDLLGLHRQDLAPQPVVLQP